MNITIDKRQSKAIYVDKYNNHIANINDIIRLIFDNYSSVIDKYIAIITGVYNLNKTESEILKYIISNKNNTTSGEIYYNVSKAINKSNSTVIRAIDSLRTKRLIYNDNNIIKLSTSILVDIDTISKAKFIVIEINPKVTSNNITI